MDVAKNLNWCAKRNATVAMLCKTAVARKVLLQSWKDDKNLSSAKIYKIDAQRYFGAAVDACLLFFETGRGSTEKTCGIYENLDADRLSSRMGYADGTLVAEMKAFEKCKHLIGKSTYKWRSGIKHDSSPVMELTQTKNGFLTSAGQFISLEREYVFPLFKGSEIAAGAKGPPTRWVIVPQRRVGEDTRQLSLDAPKVWAYLISNSELLDNRKSSIYKNRSRFSIFGIGDYSFASWKVAISALYKKLRFTVIGKYKDLPILVDDTAYSIACSSLEEAELICRMLNSSVANEFFSSFIFWDSKRPITTAILNRLDIAKLAIELNVAEEFQKLQPVSYIQTTLNL